MRRWAGRIAIGLGVVLLVRSGCSAARPASRRARPIRCSGRRATARGTIEIVVVSNGYHAGLALPRAALAEFASGRGYPALIAVTQRFAAFDWIEFGWGDREFYRSVPTVGDVSLPARAARAVPARQHDRCCMSSASAAIRRRLSPAPRLVRVPLSRNGFDQMLAEARRDIRAAARRRAA